MRKVFGLLAMIFTISVSPMLTVQACETNIVVQMIKENANMPMADVIVTKFRSHNGVPQYRRWNETHSCWVDPDWIDLN